MALDADLIAYYDAEARGEHRSAHGDLRLELRRRFAELLRYGEVRTLIDVGAGPGLDTALWAADGFTAVGVDLAHANVERMRDVGLAGVTGSLYVLPFRSETFDALWTMSTSSTYLTSGSTKRSPSCCGSSRRERHSESARGADSTSRECPSSASCGRTGSSHSPRTTDGTRCSRDRPTSRCSRPTSRPAATGGSTSSPSYCPELTRARTLRASGCRRRERRCRCRTTSLFGRTPAFVSTHA